MDRGKKIKHCKILFHPLFSCTLAVQVGEYSCSVDLHLGTKPNGTKYREESLQRSTVFHDSYIKIPAPIQQF